MDGMNVFYRAFLEYKKRTETDKNIRKMRDALQAASTDKDELEVIRLSCEIDEDWIKIIEIGLEHVEKAIHEERQFIRKEGEVVPVEKLKRVSTETVRHLAKHSNLITREPEPGEEVMPEKLYMAENLSDYAVYENRFLYMLLCYTRDFINVRLDKILEFGKTCRITMNAQKNTRIGKKFIQYQSSFYYEDKNDRAGNEKQNELIERIETIQRLTVALLMTPLMHEVSKAPMLSPPITRTNVLRMNVHFKAALEMYGELTAYTKVGYTLIEEKNVFKPFQDACNVEFSEMVLLQAYLAYKYGNKQEEALKKTYDLEEVKEREQKQQELSRRLLVAKQQLEEKKMTAEAYILLQEDLIKLLEEDKQALKRAEAKISRLNEKINAQEADIQALQENTTRLNEDLLEKGEQMRAQERAFAEKTKEIEGAAAEKIKAQEAACQVRIQEMDAECLSAKKAMDDAKAECKKIEESYHLTQAQLHGLRQQYNLIPDSEEYTSKEQFLQLEKEFAAFEKFLKKQWKPTKKRIRKDILWTKKDE
jgi:hypothetical protein